MTTFLRDVNVVMALIGPAHMQHDRAHDWFSRVGKRSFAICPITENGLLRIVGHPSTRFARPSTSVYRVLAAMSALPDITSGLTPDS